MIRNKDIAYATAFLLTVLFYCLFIARNGYEEWDSGFITGLAWRIINGEKIYTDFIYTKPPVTPYLAALYMKILPEEGQFYFIRCVNYVLFAIQTLLVVFAVNAVAPLKKVGVNPWGLATAGFSLSYLNASPYPWYTQDGLLFAAAALFAMAYPQRRRTLHIILVALFALLSALCKQSFYPVPLVFGAWIFFESGYKKALVYLLSLCTFTGIFRALILQYTTLEGFIGMISGQTHFEDLYYSNVYGYLHRNWEIYMVIAAATITAFLFSTAPKTLKTVALWFIGMQFAAAVVLLFAGKAPLGSIFAFNGCTCAILYALLIRRESFRNLMLPTALLCIAWCASVSWGYPYPVFCTTGIILAFITVSGEAMPARFRSYYTVIGAVAFIAGMAYNWFPYRQQAVTQLTADMAKISPKLKYIHADEATYTKFAELKALVAQYGQPYIVTTNYSGAHYLFGTRNPLPADWMINSEYNFRLRDMVETAAKSHAMIFLENRYNPTFDRASLRYKHYSYFSQYIRDHCTPIEKLPTFTVYNSRDLYEALPETAAP